MASVDSQIRATAKTISDAIDALAHDRNLLSRLTIKQLRDLVEAVAVRLHLGSGEAEFHFEKTHAAIEWVGSSDASTNFLYGFHRMLQAGMSHYSFEGDAAERLMLKYYEFLLRTRVLMKELDGTRILRNLEKFPLDTDPALTEYHEKIAERVVWARELPGERGNRTRYYVHSVRPFFVGGRIFYEVTFSNIADQPNKFDRVIAFTDIAMTDAYAAQLRVYPDEIEILGQRMPILIIRQWDVSIRPCELEHFAEIFGKAVDVDARSAEYTRLMEILTRTSFNLIDLTLMSDTRYAEIRTSVTDKIVRPQIFPALDEARRVVQGKLPGHNIVRYLMLEMRNRVIKNQLGDFPHRYLSRLYLSPKVSPFDQMPFCAMPVRHVPHFRDLMASVDARKRKHEFLGRRIRNNVERHGTLYTPVGDFSDLGDIDELVQTHNDTLPPTANHAGRVIEKDMDHVFMHTYEDSSVAIVEHLQELAASGVSGYQSAMTRWLAETTLDIDDSVKRKALPALFATSKVALVYGAAGTGKSTMVGYIASYFDDKQKLFLAHTHSAKSNLERRAATANADFRTIKSHINRSGRSQVDVLVIDECSIVSNDDLLAVLRKTDFKLLVLVGDVYQIASIQFGNWFNIIRGFMPKSTVFELTKPHRTNSSALLDFWARVRALDEGIEEAIAAHGYSADLDESLFQTYDEREIILCLNYDGLYGINNINRFRQSANPGKSVVWGVNTYKVGDPVLFQHTDRFAPFIYNNLKGRIVDFTADKERIRFDIWLDRPVTELDVDGEDLEYVGDSTVRFYVHRRGSTDRDNEKLNTFVPFQVAYAVSIHKAQGLEYESVKVVITEANSDDVTHSVFYTAVTRARTHLKIYWSPETQKRVLERLEHGRSGKDVALLRARRGVRPLR
ncbi:MULTISPECIES: ATP-dependent DNA helicase [unclassified Microbacterium]|uniref:ATP-dependent DNA helicase n=1 Tax=unclassified Microbacterium TaxID=2609290 RepID=UPI00300FB284